MDHFSVTTRRQCSLIRQKYIDQLVEVEAEETSSEIIGVKVVARKVLTQTHQAKLLFTNMITQSAKSLLSEKVKMCELISQIEAGVLGFWGLNL